MEPVESIDRLGFMRWYERRLLVAHGWLVAVILSMMAAGGSIELLHNHEALRAYAVMMGAGVAGLYAFRRYLLVLADALRVSERAKCTSCGVFGRFRTISASHVRCRACSHEWRLIG